MRLTHGVDHELEKAADELLFAQTRAQQPADKQDILTPWKMEDRLSREVYNTLGVADGALRRGMFHRAWNDQQTRLNSGDTAVGDAVNRRVPIPSNLEAFGEGGLGLSPAMSAVFGIEVP